MATLISFFPLLLSTAIAPIAVGDLQVNAQGDATTEIVLRLGAPPTFTTSTDPERFVVDLLEVRGEEGRLASDAPGVRGVRLSPSAKGTRLIVELEPGAQPTVDVDGRVVSIRVEKARRSKAAAAADDMDAALGGLAVQVARIGDEMALLQDPAAAPAASAESPLEEAAAEELPVEEDPALVAASVESSLEAGPVEELPVEEAPAPAPAVVAASVETSPEESPVGASVAEETSAVVSAAVQAPAPAARQVPSAVVAPPRPATDAAAELVHLGFRPTHDGAELIIRTEGAVSPSLEEGVGEMVLVLPHTTIRRPNDKRPFDATYFNTPVGLVRPSVSRQGVRIVIQLRQEAMAKVVQKTGEIVVELLSR